jgi:hypothetical protein
MYSIHVHDAITVTHMSLLARLTSVSDSSPCRGSRDLMRLLDRSSRSKQSDKDEMPSMEDRSGHVHVIYKRIHYYYL